MDNARAARLLRKWIPFNGMDTPLGWEVPPEEEPVWPRVQRTTLAIRYAIAHLEGSPVPNDIDREEAIALMAAWPEDNGMDDAEAWDAEIYPFVRNCRKAIDYAVNALKNEGS